MKFVISISHVISHILNHVKSLLISQHIAQMGFFKGVDHIYVS